MTKLKNLVGQVFGRLIVLEKDTTDGVKRVRWLCKCVCGEVKSIDAAKLKSGNTKSCGCLQEESRHKHDFYKSPTYNSWDGMLQRCTNSNSMNYKDYGGRGITVCDRWNPKVGGSFVNFLEDMGEKPKGLTLDKIDNNVGYSKDNCRWLSNLEQQRNRRISPRNTTGFNGVQKVVNGYKGTVQIKGILKRSKTFSYRYYGITALQEAVKWRESAVNYLKSVGFFYGEKHGT